MRSSLKPIKYSARAFFAHGWRNIHELSKQSNGARSLTGSILINLFIKLELNNFLLPPLLSIVFVQECSVVLRKIFDEGRGGKAYIFARKMESLGKSLSSASKIEDRHFDFMCFSFVNMLCFDYRPLLTRRWKPEEVFMTMMRYRSQLHGRRCQRIDTRKPENGIELTYMGEIKLNKAHRFFSWQENLMVSSRFLSLWSPR